MHKTFDDVENLNPKLEQFSQVLEQIIFHYSSSDSPSYSKQGLVVSIEGKYGSGKTTFLDLFATKVEQPDKYYGSTGHERENGYVYSYKFERDMLGLNESLKINQTEKKEVVIVRYNAWENDDSNVPFVSLVGQICENFPESNTPAVKDFKTSAKAVLKATGKIVASFCNADKILNEGQAVYQELTEKEFDSQIDEYINAKDKKLKFKDLLSDLKNTTNTAPPLKIIFVDELDRCMPIYAVRFLEVIKHYFNAKNTVFVISIDKAQLINIIKKVYGFNFDAENYLSRFFDFHLQLPSGRDFCRNLAQKNFPANADQEILQEISIFFNFAPREQVKFYQVVKFSRTIQKWARAEYYIILGLYLYNSRQIEKLKHHRVSLGGPEEVEMYFIKFLLDVFEKTIDEISPVMLNAIREIYFAISSKIENNSAHIRSYLTNPSNASLKNDYQHYLGDTRYSRGIDLDSFLSKAIHFC